MMSITSPYSGKSINSLMEQLHYYIWLCFDDENNKHAKEQVVLLKKEISEKTGFSPT